MINGIVVVVVLVEVEVVDVVVVLVDVVVGGIVVVVVVVVEVVVVVVGAATPGPNVQPASAPANAIAAMPSKATPVVARLTIPLILSTHRAGDKSGRGRNEVASNFGRRSSLISNLILNMS